MIKTPMYTYLGTNGTITSTVFLEGIYSIKKVRLEAEPNHVLVKDGNETALTTIVVPENEVALWSEIDKA